MTSLVLCICFVVAGMLWCVTGRSPFFLLARLCLHLEAARREMIASARLAGRSFYQNYGMTERHVRREILGKPAGVASIELVSSTDRTAN